MKKEFRMTKSERGAIVPAYRSFVIRHSFVIRNWSFVIFTCWG